MKRKALKEVATKVEMPKPVKGTVKVTLPKVKVIEKFVTKLGPEIAALLDYVTKAEVKTTDNYQWAGKALHKVAMQFTEIDTKKREWTQPLRDAVDQVNDVLRPVLTDSKSVENTLKGKLIEYAVAAYHSGIEVPKLDTASVNLEWTAEITDPTQIPPEFMVSVPNVDALIARAKATGGKVVIPGVRAYLRGDVRTDRK